MYLNFDTVYQYLEICCLGFALSKRKKDVLNSKKSVHFQEQQQFSNTCIQKNI